MNRKEGYKLLMAYGIHPLEIDTQLLNNSTSDAVGKLEISVEGWYYVKIAGGGASAGMIKQQNTGSGSSGAGFIGEIYLTKGTWDWKVGKKGSAGNSEPGGMSYLLREDNHEKGIIANGGRCSGYYPDPAAEGGVLEQKNIKTRNVLVAKKGNNGFPGLHHAYQTTPAESVFRDVISENWGRGGVANWDDAQPGVVTVKFKGV